MSKSNQAWIRNVARAGSLVAGLLIPLPAHGQATGLEVGVLPAINFDADEGFGYGVLAEF
jgi:hypothetical protein